MFNTRWAIFQLYHDENKLYIGDVMSTFALYSTKNLTCIFTAYSIHWNNSPRVDKSLHSYRWSWFRAIQYLLLYVVTLWYSVFDK
jgi:hypothetical protein